MKLESFLWAAAVGLAAAQNYTRCATPNLPEAQADELDALVTEDGSSLVSLLAAAASVRTKLLTIKQTMNRAYSDMGFTFSLMSTDFTVNNQWAASSLGSSAERAMKTALKRGSYGELDLYFTTDVPNRILGWCYFPVSNPSSSELILDGCVNLADSMPGGTAAPFNLGATATHEIGHWLGLFHVWQGNSCSGGGDQVADTPIQSTPSYGCDVGKDTCPGGGVDNINNWMDYSDDACMDRFSAGQISRATALFNQLRSGR
ncbi:hypothetical protein AC579_888 [Pseudocercospora musae]|uniref:Peptidase M43 pregnancy-associated plasma-A domain-containing protein n=1 Tax=Pseudocercospora musae TaxID=113226 RepID=A0A139IN10_9PEZI|nr:hypothetical protein AC579_888 [Pseudocercospora musae]